MLKPSGGKHLSGRPVMRQRVREPSRWRVPDIEPVTPRLRGPMVREPMGFYTGTYIQEDEYVEDRGT